jgi:YggT family protein
MSSPEPDSAIDTPPEDLAEPAPPQRGPTRQERGREVSAAQQAAEEKTSMPRMFLAAAGPRFVLSQAEGYPIVVKQFLQFCLILIYPAWVFGVAVSAAVFGIVYGVLWVLLWPIRAGMKKKDPEAYAASQRK